MDSNQHRKVQRGFEDNKRGNYNWNAVYSGAYNETLVLMEHLSRKGKLAYAGYSLLIGNIFTPGILNSMRLIPREKLGAFKRFVATIKGRFDAVKDIKWSH